MTKSPAQSENKGMEEGQWISTQFSRNTVMIRFCIFERFTALLSHSLAFPFVRSFLSFALRHSIIYLKWYDELWQCHSTKNEIVKLCIFCMIHARVRIPLTMRIQFFSLSAVLNAHTYIHKMSLHGKLRVIWRTHAWEEMRISNNNNSNNRYGNKPSEVNKE